MKVAGIIPARYASSRLPGKALFRETGKYLIQHVWERARRASNLDLLLIATDDERIRRAALEFGAEVRMTAASHLTGTDRVAEVAASLDANIIVNIQGDEPEIEPGAIEAVVAALANAPDAAMSTLASRTTDASRVADPAVVKLVCSADGRALYFSRAPIPYARDGGATSWLLHVGLYAYRREFLLKFAQLPQTPLERIEKLEQLRALENGYAIQVMETDYEALGVDTAADYAAFVKRYRGTDRKGDAT